MKCPKCGYLGFEPVDRCRNCGYEFSLAAPAVDLELSLRPSPASSGPADSLAEEILGRGQSVSTPADLPLFGAPIADDTPLITKASPPRPPLAVRRATPDLPRVTDVSRTRTMAPRAATLDLGLEVPSPEPARIAPSQLTPLDAARVTGADHRATVADHRSIAADHGAAAAAEDASLGARLMAVILDAAILGAIDVIVIYFTLQICGVGLDEWRVLPLAPLVAFFVLQNGGYLVGFTAGGQTLGKMAAGIRVISAESTSPIDVGRALIRELTWFALTVPAGLGLLSAVFNSDRRGLHDRFAGTRVVRVTS
jgi:uncharacterized RDD family membrane protein YckC